jgi:two-component system sensor histidine kinase KdpD
MRPVRVIPKRWQDVDELLAAGIDVYDAQRPTHRKLNDVVGQITGVRVNETLPDTFFEAADEVELIDLPPDELLTRLRAGKVYVPQEVERALAISSRRQSDRVARDGAAADC